MDTIFAVSSGAPPAAIAVIRISGPEALGVAEALAGKLPPPRSARLRTLRDPADGSMLDRALMLTFPGPGSATGEDLVELHVHGGRAVVAAVERVLAALPHVRPAVAGEFTRRALANNVLDLAQAEALGDLLMAETEMQRRSAMVAAEGGLTRQVTAWRETLVVQAAVVEAAIEYGEDIGHDDDAALLAAVRERCAAVASEMAAVLARPSTERLRDGFRVVLAGPPNSGKSSLLNALVGREVAIVSPVAGTTRDRIEAPVMREGLPVVLSDTAGLRTDCADSVERIGIERARAAMAGADLVLWLGDEPPESEDWVALHPRCDEQAREIVPDGRIGVSAVRGDGLELVWRGIVARLVTKLGRPDEVRLNDRQRRCCADAMRALAPVAVDNDMLLVAEGLRAAIAALSMVTGAERTDAMLDALFSRFCIGK